MWYARKKAPVAPQQPVPAQLKKRLYTEQEIADRNRKIVETRRINEDRRKDDASRWTLYQGRPAAHRRALRSAALQPTDNA
ncbi:hypothetical protein ACS2UM_26960, partial [Bacillus cereus group sp. BC317]|uniref:hypothetical protein n=1 Tax=Bacillus cereus group sp. BC317 TaxID=3445314 RepID=UPI003F1F3D51